MTRSRRIVIEERRWALRVWYSDQKSTFVAFDPFQDPMTVRGHKTFRTRREARAFGAKLKPTRSYPVRCTVRLIVEG